MEQGHRSELASGLGVARVKAPRRKHRSARRGQPISMVDSAVRLGRLIQMVSEQRAAKAAATTSGTGEASLSLWCTPASSS